VKHLSPIRLAALADGPAAAGREAAHLQGCPDCRAELAVLRALAQGLEAAPAVPRALRQATLRRLGLAPAKAPASNLKSPWLWGPALAAGLAVALLLPRFQAGTRATAGAPSPASAPAPQPLARPLPRCAPALGAPAAPVAPAPEAPGSNGEVAMAPQVKAPEAVGAQPAQPAAALAPDIRDQDPGLKPTPGAGSLEIGAVRNNLLRPGSRLSVSVTLGGADFLDAAVLDARGRKVATLFQGPAGPGDLQLQWDGAAPSGAYTVLIQTRGASRRVPVLVVH
jgi:hypothetical protein